MFEAKLDDISLFRESIATISELLDESELHVKNDGIEMVAADRAVVTVIDFALSRGAFKEYVCDEEKKIGVNLSSLLQILRRAQPNDALKISLGDKKLNLILEGLSTRKFTLALIDISKEETPDRSKLEGGFTAAFTVNSELLNSGIEDAEIITDSVVFTVQKDTLHMRADGDASSAQLELASGGESLKVHEINEPVRARYSIDYLKKIFKARKLASEAKIAMATDYPMKVQFEVPLKCKLAFILAPRVEEV
jgi:proliferating cell nuclear antigen